MKSSAQPTLDSTSDFIPIRNLKYHVRRWGARDKPMLFLTHGWLDVSETMHLMVQPLLARFQVLAPDWRGLGLTEWPQDGYWFPDYVGDLEAVIDHYSPAQPVLLAGHSMGAQAASLYAGLRATRVAKLILMDALFLPDMPAELAPRRYRDWLEDLKDLPQPLHYASFEELAQRVKKKHPQLSDERALFVARCWGRARDDGRVHLLADPKHRLNGPGLFRVAESIEIWKQVAAPTLFLDAGKSIFRQALSKEELERRRSCFRGRHEQVIEQAGHMLHFDEPEATGRAMLEFLVNG
ncbi:MAG TPA: alpha/beta hydrolase [Nevskiaceae bacterium]|nr:alpha/beta hydrolase [Nevskiaceae bacterium]